MSNTTAKLGKLGNKMGEDSAVSFKHLNCPFDKMGNRLTENTKTACMPLCMFQNILTLSLPCTIIQLPALSVKAVW